MRLGIRALFEAIHKVWHSVKELGSELVDDDENSRGDSHGNAIFGGAQMMAIHKLIGGQRVIDTLGPDDENISWTGRFVGAGTVSLRFAQSCADTGWTDQLQPKCWHQYLYCIVLPRSAPRNQLEACGST